MSRRDRKSEERTAKLALTTAILYLAAQVIELITKLTE